MNSLYAVSIILSLILPKEADQIAVYTDLIEVAKSCRNVSHGTHCVDVDLIEDPDTKQVKLYLESNKLSNIEEVIETTVDCINNPSCVQDFNAATRLFFAEGELSFAGGRW